MFPQLVVFDIAGTTVWDQNFVNQAVIEGFSEHGIVVGLDEINPLMGIPKPKAIETVLRNQSDPRADDHQFVMVVHDSFLSQMQNFYRTSEEVRPIAGVESTFMQLKSAGVKVALDTGFDRTVTDIILGRLRWNQDVIDFSVTSDEVANGRPAPDMIFVCMQATGVLDAANVAKVGDTPSDIMQGLAAKCRWVVGVCEGTHTREQLAEYHPTHLIPSVAQLIDEVFIAPDRATDI